MTGVQTCALPIWCARAPRIDSMLIGAVVTYIRGFSPRHDQTIKAQSTTGTTGLRHPGPSRRTWTTLVLREGGGGSEGCLEFHSAFYSSKNKAAIATRWVAYRARAPQEKTLCSSVFLFARSKGALVRETDDYDILQASSALTSLPSQHPQAAI